MYTGTNQGVKLIYLTVIITGVWHLPEPAFSP